MTDFSPLVGFGSTDNELSHLVPGLGLDVVFPFNVLRVPRCRRGARSA
jgi:hypothetical protein